jgi:hypothetical protein
MQVAFARFGRSSRFDRDPPMKGRCRMSSRIYYYASVLTLLVASSSASAQDPMRDTGAGPARVFGNKMELAISSDASFVIQHSSHSVTSISLAPAADYFVAKNVSIGASLLFDYQHTGGNSATRFGIGPRFGYYVAFSDMVGIWPKIGFSYSYSSRTIALSGAGTSLEKSNSGGAFTLNLFAPIMFTPVPHFFVGFGPFLDADLSGDDKITTWGGKLTLGGWLDV